MTIYTHYLVSTDLVQLSEISAVLFGLGRPQVFEPDDPNTTRYLFPVLELASGGELTGEYALGFDYDYRVYLKAEAENHSEVTEFIAQYYDSEESDLMLDRIREERDITVRYLLPQSIKDQLQAAETIDSKIKSKAPVNVPT